MDEYKSAFNCCCHTSMADSPTVAPFLWYRADTLEWIRLLVVKSRFGHSEVTVWVPIPYQCNKDHTLLLNGGVHRRQIWQSDLSWKQSGLIDCKATSEVQVWREGGSDTRTTHKLMWFNRAWADSTEEKRKIKRGEERQERALWEAYNERRDGGRRGKKTERSGGGRNIWRMSHFLDCNFQ